MDLAVDVPAHVDRRAHRVAQPVEGVLELGAQSLVVAVRGTEAAEGGAGDIRTVGGLFDVPLAAQHAQEWGESVRAEAGLTGDFGVGDTGGVPCHRVQDAQGVLGRVVRRGRLVLESHGVPPGLLLGRDPDSQSPPR